jgi:hypothetical protein
MKCKECIWKKRALSAERKYNTKFKDGFGEYAKQIENEIDIMERREHGT